MINNYCEKGAFNLSMFIIESAFVSMRKKPWLRPLDDHIERAFLDSDFVQVACDCSDNFIQENILKEFDKEFNNKQYD